MSRLQFKSNAELLLGVEIELQLVDPRTGDLSPVAPLVLQDLRDVAGASRIKSEIFQSMLEIDTPICRDAFEAGRSLRDSLDLVRQAGAKRGVEIMMSGTHPFANYSDRLLTPMSRYHSLVDRNQWIARRLQIFGLHVHLGMRDGEHAIKMLNALSHYLPVVLAMSASSPFWHSEDTGLASSRITFFEATPTGGHPYLFQSWTEFEELVECLLASRSITTIKDLWWDIRPNTEYGTVEIRIADCPPTIREVEALVALIHAIAVSIDQELSSGRRFLPPPEWVLRENKWRASRYGVAAELINQPNGGVIPFDELWSALRVDLSGVISSFSYSEFFEFLEMVLKKGPSYARQRGHFDGDFAAIINHLVQENKSDNPDWG